MGAEFITGSLQHILSIPHLASARSFCTSLGNYHSHCHIIVTVILFLINPLIKWSLWRGKQLETWLQRGLESRSQLLASGCVYYTTYKEVRSGEGWCSVCMLMASTSGETSRDSKRPFYHSRRGQIGVRFLFSDLSGLLHLLSPISCSWLEVFESCQLFKSSQFAAAQLFSVCGSFTYGRLELQRFLFCVSQEQREQEGKKEGKIRVKAWCKRVWSLWLCAFCAGARAKVSLKRDYLGRCWHWKIKFPLPSSPPLQSLLSFQLSLFISLPL